MFNLVITVFLLLFYTSIYAKPIIEIQTDASLSEQQQGYEFLQFLTNSNLLVKDIELSSYLSNLGQYLSSYNTTKNHFDFYLLNDDSVNAFAGPYGYIGINTGLILISDYEAELASVIAHEIAHVSQKHLIRHKEKTQNQSFLLAAAIITSILSKNSKVSQAIISTSVAGVAQQSISFTREHEWEADKVGIDLLQKTSFNPRGMASFFNKLQDDKDAVEYLRTHPLSINRVISSLESLFKEKVGKYQNSLNYEIVKQRLYYQRFNRINSSNKPIVNQYMLGFEAFSIGNYKQAKKIVELITTQDSPYPAILRARIYSKLNEYKKAQNTIEKAQDLNPNNQAIAYYKALIYQQSGNIKKAISNLKGFIRKHKVHYQLYYLLADLYLKNNQLDRHHITKAFGLVSQGRYKDGLFQLQRAKVIASHTDLYSLIKAHIKQIQHAIELFEQI